MEESSIEYLDLQIRYLYEGIQQKQAEIDNAYKALLEVKLEKAKMLYPVGRVIVDNPLVFNITGYERRNSEKSIAIMCFTKNVGDNNWSQELSVYDVI